MPKKLSIRMRLTLLSVLLLTICCVCLTLILNLSANQMANVIEAAPTVPATEIFSGTLPNGQSTPALDSNKTPPSSDSKIARTQFAYQSIFYMAFIVLAGGVLTYYLSGRALRPLQKLSKQMMNCTVRNLSEDLPMPESHDEIADLTHSFNEMSTKLNSAFAMQKRFSQSAAHELRTPLTVLKTKVDVFNKKHEHTTEEYDNLLSVITTHTNRLSNLVKDLLDLANMDELECNQTVNANALLAEIITELTTLADEKNVHITLSGEELLLKGNSNLLHLAFYNLIENAIKYNQKNGTIAVQLSSQGEHALITIRDSGIGIPSEMQKLIFEPFFRVDSSRSRKMGGAGLGLATTKSIMDKHKGTITVSDCLDGGTVFKLIL